MPSDKNNDILINVTHPEEQLVIVILLQVAKNTLNRALSMMDLGSTLDEPVPGALETPAAKKPRLAPSVSEHLKITPPAVVGEQTVPKLLILKSFMFVLGPQGLIMS